MPISLTDKEIQRGAELLWLLEAAIDEQPEEVRAALADSRMDFHRYLAKVYRSKDGHLIRHDCPPAEALDIEKNASSVLVLTEFSGGTDDKNGG